MIGSNWKGTSYMRALALKIKDANTEKQRHQRAKFIIANNFLKTMTPFIRFGYKGYAKTQSEYNAAMSYIMKNAMTGSKDTLAIDYDKVLLTRGSLTTAVNPTASITGNKVMYTWTDNSGTGDAQATDRAMLLVYNKKKGDALAVYLGFRSEDGRSVANSACLKNDAESGGGGESGSEPGGGENPLG